ncbi:hypothetical protein B0H14DRAFT_3643449 [Mycena olivaceomarginata]|nr:hypothetical protein B0H14DRAFT_3643449 [Mycena olivaceomarginata]
MPAVDRQGSICVAEQRMRAILDQRRIIEVAPNLRVEPWLRWNFQMIAWTVLLSGLALLPYTYIIIHDTVDRTFSATWMYPLLRVAGSVLAITAIQLIIQFRILAIVRDCSTVYVADHLFQGEIPNAWDPSLRARDCLRAVRDHVDFRSQRKARQCTGIDSTNQNTDTVEDPPVDSFKRPFKHVDSFTPFPNTSGRTPGQRAFFNVSIILFGISLVMGMAATGVGYIGCFKIVQSATNGTGPSIWLGLEIVLSLLRMGMWAVNPTTDDPPEPITILEKAPHETKKFRIGWMLENSIFVADFHAVIIDFPRQPGAHAQTTGTLMVQYLTQGLGVPQQQVYHLLEPNAQVIEQTLRALAERTDIRNGSPIIIYVSDHTNTQRPWRIGDQELGLLYSSFFNLIRLITQNKGDNVVIILDASYPGLEPDAAIGLEMQPFVILAASSEGLVAAVDDDEHLGLFTKSLIALLKSSKFEELTYQGLIARVQLGTTRTETYSGWVATGGWSVGGIHDQSHVGFSGSSSQRRVTEVTASVGISGRTGFGASFGMTRFSGTSVETETRPDWPRPRCIGAMKNRPIFNGLKKSVQTSVDSELMLGQRILPQYRGTRVRNGLTSHHWVHYTDVKLLTQVKNSRSNPNLTGDYIGEQFRIGPRSIDYMKICARWTRKRKVQPSSLWCKLESNGRARLAWISMPSLWMCTDLQFEDEFLGDSLHTSGSGRKRDDTGRILSGMGTDLEGGLGELDKFTNAYTIVGAMDIMPPKMLVSNAASRNEQSPPVTRRELFNTSEQNINVRIGLRNCMRIAKPVLHTERAGLRGWENISQSVRWQFLHQQSLISAYVAGRDARVEFEETGPQLWGQSFVKGLIRWRIPIYTCLNISNP